MDFEAWIRENLKTEDGKPIELSDGQLEIIRCLPPTISAPVVSLMERDLFCFEEKIDENPS